MNYRHGFHAGNFADVVKHSLLVLLLEALGAKPSPWHYYDSHAGAGAYDLGGETARRSGEAQGGIRKLWAARGHLPAEAERLCGIVAALNPGLPAGAPPPTYPGSPRVALTLARDSDRLTLAELLSQEARLLKAEFKREPRVAVHERDGYEMLRALAPPAERRGLALLDPPYESPQEFEALVQAVVACHGRWPGGVYALWYPIKDEAARKRFLRSMEHSGLRRILLTEFRLGAGGEGLVGSGMLVLNPPWQSDGAMRECLEGLVPVLAPQTGRAEVGWLVSE
jgi:23S rRNA (adenine2030-N6)-methyltransferase